MFRHNSGDENKLTAGKQNRKRRISRESARFG